MSTPNYSLGQIGDYEIKQLKVFKTVVDCGGFSAAETALNIGRSTISLHISNLESRLNLSLCKRGRAGFSLTQEGQIIYQMTNDLLDSLEGFRTTVNNLNASLTGKLRVALSDTVSLDERSHFPKLIRAFSTQANDVMLHTNVAPMADIERMVLNDEADIGFIPYHRQLDGLNYIPLYQDTCYLYCHASHPLVALTAEEQAIQVNQFPTTHAGVKPHEGISAQINEMDLSAVSYFYDTRLALILSGQYIGFLPDFYAQAYLDKDELVAILPEQRHYHLGVAVISRKTAQPNKARELFIDIIHDEFKQD